MYAAFIKKIRILLFLSNINQSRALNQTNIWGCVPEHSCSVCSDYYFFARSLCPFPYLKLHQEEHLWKLALQAGYGQVWHPAWNVTLFGSVITQIVIPVSWGILSHLPGKAVGINLGLLAFWICCHPHVQDVVFHLWADRWTESRPCTQLSGPWRGRDPFSETIGICFHEGCSAPLMCLEVQQTLTLRKGEGKTHHCGDEIQEHSPLYYQSIERDLERAVLLWQGQGWCLRDSAGFMKCSGMNAHLCTLPEPKSLGGLKGLPWNITLHFEDNFLSSWLRIKTKKLSFRNQSFQFLSSNHV